MTTSSKMHRHRHLAASERYQSTRIVSYLCLDGSKFATQYGDVLDVIETCCHHRPVSSSYRYYS